MPTQLSQGKPFDLSDLDGQLIPWRQVQPRLIDIEGQPFVPIFTDTATLNAVMASIGATDYTIEKIDEGYDFISRLTDAGIKACFNVHLLGERLRYTEIRMDWQTQEPQTQEP